MASGWTYAGDLQRVEHVGARIAPPIDHVHVERGRGAGGARDFEVEGGIESVRRAANVVVDAGRGEGRGDTSGQTASGLPGAIAVDHFDDGIERIAELPALRLRFHVNRGAGNRDQLVVVVVGRQRSVIGRIDVGRNARRKRSRPE